MATGKKKTVSISGKKKVLSAPRKSTLIWEKHPVWGKCADYKLGTIYHNQRGYFYTTYTQTYSAKSLADAKKKLDEYTEMRKAEYKRKHGY